MSNVRMFLVGGAVRDHLAGLDPKDLDFAFEGLPSFAAMKDHLTRNGFEIFTEEEHGRGGTALIRAAFPRTGKRQLVADFVRCRDDVGIGDGRRPSSVVDADILTDLARRDFTVNAMAIDEQSNLLDPHGGQADLAAGVLRFVGDPAFRLQEDALRAFRAFRFEVTKGLTLEPASHEAILRMGPEAFAAIHANPMQQEFHAAFKKGGAEATLRTLVLRFPNLLAIAAARGIWFEPSLTQRKGVLE